MPENMQAAVDHMILLREQQNLTTQITTIQNQIASQSVEFPDLQNQLSDLQNRLSDVQTALANGG